MREIESASLLIEIAVAPLQAAVPAASLEPAIGPASALSTRRVPGPLAQPAVKTQRLASAITTAKKLGRSIIRGENWLPCPTCPYSNLHRPPGDHKLRRLLSACGLKAMVTKIGRWVIKLNDFPGCDDYINFNDGIMHA